MKPSWSTATADQKKGPKGDGVLKSSVKAAATPNGTSPAAAVAPAASQSAYVIRLRQIELAVLNPADEGAPFARGEEEAGPGLVLAVPDRHASAGQWRGLHAVAVTVAVSTLSPECAGKIVAIYFVPFATPLTRIGVRLVSPSGVASVHSNDPYLGESLE